MSNPTADSQPNQSTAHERQSAHNKKAVVVGIYGIPGSGKTFLLKQLEDELELESFAFYEGSQMIANVMPGGLEAFQQLKEQEKIHWRQLAIRKIGKQCADSGQVGVVTGHFMFWPEEEEEASPPVITQDDLSTFTHIIYLDVPVDIIAKRRLKDTERRRPPMSNTHLKKWQQAEKAQLRCLCYQHGILFCLVSPHSTMQDNPLTMQDNVLTMRDNVLTMLMDFWFHSEEDNLSLAESRLDEIVAGKGKLETILVLDADRTLTAQDTGALFWKTFSRSRGLRDDNPLKTIFSSPLGYSYTAFRQAMLLYEETLNDSEFDALCQDVASAVILYPEFVSLLQLVAEQEHVGAVIITCGIRCIWEKVLKREGLSKTMEVIGGGRIADDNGFVVTAAVKAALVTRLRETHQLYVWAFGDSPLDLEMLSQADEAIVVVGEKQSRSRSMDEALMDAVNNKGLRARQALIPSHASPRLDVSKLPNIQLTEREFVDSVLCRRDEPPSRMQVLHLTNKNAAKLLMTPMRDAKIAGSALREAHHRVGIYLATGLVADVIGIEEYPITHVQGHQTSGYRLLHERQTSIVALMRGGEAMARGVSDAFPLAMLVHASGPDDIKLHHLQGRLTVVLVDSVVNSGKTVMRFVRRVRKFHASIRIVVVVGVAQAQAVSGDLAQALAEYSNLRLIALRLSDNNFTGTGTTDTGNRLFNTTHLP